MQPFQPSRRSWFLRTAGSLVMLYLVIAATVAMFQGKAVFFPSRQINATPSTAGMAYTDVELTTEDAVKIHGWFIPAEEPVGTVLYFHGNGGNLSNRVDLLQMLHDLNLNSMSIDYRGYGLSEGSPSEQGTYADAEAAWRYLTVERQLPASQIIVLGESLGGGVASWTAQKYAPRALVLQSTFTSLTDVGAQVLPWLPVRLLSRIHYPTLDRLEQIQCPILVVHSRDDDLIPFEHSQRNFAAAHAPKEFVELIGGHNNGFRISREAYREGLSRFLQQY